MSDTGFTYDRIVEYWWLTEYAYESVSKNGQEPDSI